MNTQQDFKTPSRMYSNSLPSVDDIVMTKVKKITDHGATCILLEYNNMEAFMAPKEYHRGRIRSMRKILREGSLYPLQVLNVDETKHVVDLTKKHVKPEEAEVCEERFKKSKIVDSLIQRAAMVSHTPCQEIYQTFVWPLYSSFPHPLDCFQDMICHDVASETYWGNVELTQETKSELIKLISKRIRRPDYKVGATIRLLCFGEKGIGAIREALQAGEEKALKLSQLLKDDEEDKDDIKNTTSVSVSVCACPDYKVCVDTQDPDNGRENVTQICEAIKDKIESIEGGHYDLKEFSVCMKG